MSPLASHPATAAEHLLWLLAEHGVEHLFLNPGTDSAPLQEAALVLAEAKAPVPHLVTCTFEAVALAAAHGYFQVTRRPQAVFVHVDVGTQNLGAMTHNVLRDAAGVVVIAGRTPYAEEPGSPGGRSHPIHWQQDVADQTGVLRPYAKWTMEVARAATLPRAVGRAVQVAASGRPGLAYLTVSRDVLMDPADPGLSRTAGYAVPRPPAPDEAALAWLAARFAAAERPLLVTGKTGRTAAGFAAVTRLADAGFRVVDTPESGCLNLPSSHPARAAGAAAAVEAADLIVVAACDVPWVPRFTAPSPDATVVHIDLDPVRADIPLWTFPVDLAITADPAGALDLLADRIGETGRAPWPLAEPAPPPPPGEGPLTAAEVVAALNAVLRPEDLVAEEAVTNAGTLARGLERSLPCTLFGTGSPGLGWGLGGAVGVSMASPGRRVVTVVGDGAFMFGVPTAALALAAEAGAPILAVVLNNEGYKASRTPVFELFPDGLSKAAGDAVGTRFAAAPDLAAVARACHAHGERVTDRAELVPALARALAALDGGRSAVVDVAIARD